MENLSSNNAGAISALKGYRAQFIYSLVRILSRREAEFSFQPEGKFEDLDIYDEQGKVIEIIQVKNLSSTLTLSSILTQEPTSFIKRGIKAHENGTPAKITLVSFGDINEDVKELATDKFSSTLVGKLKKSGLSNGQIELLEKHFKCEIVSQDGLLKRGANFINDLTIHADINISVDLLVYWIYNAAIQQHRIERNTLQEQLGTIGKFLSDRVGFNDTYGTLIRPLTLNEEARDVEKLQADFYKGIAASYSHIKASVDILRPDKLELINQKFRQSNTVFIHGASGQGKSTIAYRYLHDYCEAHTAFVISLPPDLATLYKIVHALEAMADGLPLPVTLYIDVTPGNHSWITVLQELSSKKKVNFLITIREEDWNSIQIDDKVIYSELELGLDKVEAEIIYKSLNEFQIDLRFTDFQNAWDTFGGSGPLLEFVYLITQGESLPAKLKSQIDRVTDDDSGLAKDKIRLLRFVVLADCYNARVVYKNIALYLNLDNIFRVTELLENEYLVKLSEGKTFITGLHPVRSNLLRRFLFDPAIHDESKFVLESLHFLDANTVAAFLRHAFRFTSVAPPSLLNKLTEIEIASWIFYDSVLKSLLWKGVTDFIGQNRDVLHRAVEKFGRSWSAMVNIDIAKALEGESVGDIISLFSEEQRAEAEDINSKLQGAADIYKHCVTWISSIEAISIDPVSEEDFKGLASFVFWTNRLRLNHVTISISPESVEAGFRKHTLEVLCRTLLALKTYEKLNGLSKNASDVFLERFFRAHNVIKLEESEEQIHCEYFFNVLDGESFKDGDNFIHSKSIKIVDQLRLAFPGKEIYATDGHGHKFSFVSGMPDESHKRIPRRSLPLDYLVDINSLFINLVEYESRQDSWKEYVKKVIERRRMQVDILEKSLAAYTSYHKKGNYGALIDFVNQFKNVLSLDLEKVVMPTFPKPVLDEWGRAGESDRKRGSSDNENEMNKKKTFSLRRYESYRKICQVYDSSITAYLTLSTQVLRYLIKERTGQNTDGESNPYRASLVGQLYQAFESVDEFQRSFRKHFEKFTDRRILDTIESKERFCVAALCFIYRHFIHSTSILPGNIVKTAHEHLDQVVNTFIKTIVLEMKALGPELHTTFTVHRDVNEQQLVVLASSNSSMSIYSTVERIYNLFHRVLDKLDATSIRHAVLSKNFKSIFVIPMIGENSFNGKGYEFKLNNLIDKEFPELAQFNLIPKDIPDAIRRQHVIHSLSSQIPDFVKLERMLGNTSTAYQLLYHFVQFIPFSGVELDERGEKVLTEYLTRLSPRIHENLQEGLDLFNYFRQACLERKFIFESDQQMEDFQDYLHATCLNFFPTENDAEQGEVERAIGVGEMEQWLPRLQQLSENMGVIYVYLSDKIISNYFNLQGAKTESP